MALAAALGGVEQALDDESARYERRIAAATQIGDEVRCRRASQRARPPMTIAAIVAARTSSAPALMVARWTSRPTAPTAAMDRM